MREIVLDTETTGLDPVAGDRVVEIACLELVNRVPSGRRYQTYINPQRDMPEEAFRVHGLSSEFLSTHPLFTDVAEDFIAFLGDGDLVIHEANLATHDADIKALIGGVQTTLDTVTEMKRIHLQVVALPGQREFLITADEAGVPVDVTFIGVKYSRGDDPISFVDVLANTTVTMIRPGLHHVVISASRGSPVIDPPPNIAEFQVKHDHGSYADFGITVFQQVHDDNVGAGH